MSLSVRAVLLVLALAGAVGVAGCGETVIDDAKTEAAIEHNLNTAAGQKVTSVDCPSDVQVKAGDTFECAIQLAGGESETATLKILNSNADVELTRLEPEGGGQKPGSGSEGAAPSKGAAPGGSSAEQRSSKGKK